MNNRLAHRYLEELQRMMTQHRDIFSEEFVHANGMAILSLERSIAIDAGIELPSAQQWIPCSERLPEEDGGFYLVTDYSKSLNRRRMHVSRCYANNGGFWSDVPLGYKVIAWMPLPEAYKGKDHG